MVHVQSFRGCKGRGSSSTQFLGKLKKLSKIWSFICLCTLSWRSSVFCVNLSSKVLARFLELVKTLILELLIFILSNIYYYFTQFVTCSLIIFYILNPFTLHIKHSLIHYSLICIIINTLIYKAGRAAKDSQQKKLFNNNH